CDNNVMTPGARAQACEPGIHTGRQRKLISEPGRVCARTHRSGDAVLGFRNEGKELVLQTEPLTPPCPACGRKTAQRHLYCKNGCDILQCEACGLGRTVPIADFDPSAYYTGGYFSGEHADGYADYSGAEPVLRREFVRTVEFIRTLVPRGRLLELGCA